MPLPIKLTDALTGGEVLINPENITKVVPIAGGSSVFLTTNNWNVDVTEQIDEIQRRWRQAEWRGSSD